ncbi:uncharacterized LOC118074437 precursor [Chelonus insularis]|uniref:uncharacterized LOC118074437 precursor n=1 Tax=Chelonus insularis TaxID=460826 RepID=UPI0015899050|nr:uncharacterized LOC118074437 precursor [Chelonus insularis]KAG8148387.1 putative per os infectivity factor pif-3 [Chelonus insularis]
MISFFALFIMLMTIIVHVSLTIQFQTSDSSIMQPYYNAFVSPYTLKNDCNANTVYCFNSEDCFNKCSVFYKMEFACLKGVCKIAQSEELQNKCSLEKGVAPYLISVPELRSLDWLCKSIDLGIVKYDNKKKYVNVMCKGGTISTNYTDGYPQQHDCTCPISMVYGIVPATDLKRQHVECVAENNRWIYETNQLIYNR